jgi:hypothetical protein
VKRILAVLAVLTVGLLGITGAQAGAKPKIDSNLTPVTTVGIFIDTITPGATHSTISCGRRGALGQHETGPEGDGTLFVTNLKPQTLVCVIKITEVLEA